MRIVVSVFLQAIFIAVIAVLIGGIWWRMWMYHGWTESPGWLSYLWKADGEGAYEARMFEMMLISFVIVTAGFLSIKYFQKSNAA